MIELPIMNNELITTEHVAQQFGIHRDALLNWISRNPEYRPATKLGQTYLWTLAEIERARMGRTETRKRKKDGDRLG